MPASIRRKYERQPIDYPGILSHPAIGDVICRIRDCCAGGLLLELNESYGMLLSGNEVSVSAAVSGQDGQQPLRLHGTIAHLQGVRVGISFLHEADETTLTMLCGKPRTQETGVPAATGAGSALAPAQKQAVQQMLEDGLQRTIRPLLDQQAAEISSQFNETLLSTIGAEARQALGNALHGLGRNGREVTNQCLKKLLDWLQLSAAGGQLRIGPKSAEASNSGGLSLVDTGAFEQWLTVSSIATRAEEAYADLLDPIQVTLGYLYGSKIARNEIPIGPAAICQAYYESAEPHMDNADIASTVFAHLETEVIEQLGNYYADIVRVLEHDGLIRAARMQQRSAAAPATEPEQRSAPQPAQGQASAGPPRLDLGGGGPDAGLAAPVMPAAMTSAPASGPVVDGLLRSLQELKLPDRTPPDDPGIGNDQLLQVLKNIPTGSLARDGRLGEMLQQHLSEEGEPGLGVEQLARAELVGHIFARLSGDRRFPEAVSETLQALSVPYLKLALTEPDALADRKHPARMLLDQLSDLLVVRDELSPGLRHSIELACERLAENFPDKPEVFQEVSEEFSEIRKADDRAKLRNLDRVMATQDGQQRIIDTRMELADQLLAMRDGAGCLPAMLSQLLKAFWADGLVNLALQNGIEDDRARQGIKVTARLCETLVAMRAGAAPLSAEEHENILSTLRSGLQSSYSFDSAATDAVTRIERALREGTASSEDLAPEPVTAFFKEEERVRASRALAGNMNNPLVRKIRNMSVGQNIVVPNQQGQQKSAVLAWHAADWSRLVFVNQKGMHIRDAFLDDMVEGLRNGGWHFDAREPKSTVDDAILDVMQDISGDLSIQARMDELTGLQNRKAMEVRLEQALRQIRKGAPARNYLLLDIDRFRLLNLDYGHETGDQVLSMIGEIIQEHMPDSAIPARVGTNEFCVLLPDDAPDAAMACAKDLLSTISSLHKSTRRLPPTTVSIGILTIDRQIESLDEILQSAEAAVSCCKEQGGNQYALYAEIKHAGKGVLSQQREWERIVNEVLDGEHLQLFHQPIRPINQDDEHRHSELLLRVADQNGLQVSTFDFIVAAEGCGRIKEIDRWVLSSALTWMEEHPQELEKLGGVAINLSADSLGDERFLEFIVASIRLSRVDPRDICFELTETATVRSMEQLRDFMDGVKTLGCKFALDDFGSGMASYSYLKNLPVDYLKIDGVFIRDLPANPSDVALVRSIADFSRFMGIRTVAEFVEDQDTMDMLGDIGIDYAQGYHLARPTPLPTSAR